MDELRPDQGKLLRAGTSLLRPAHTWALLGVALGLPVAALLALLSVLAMATDGPICPAIWTALRSELLDNPVNRAIEERGFAIETDADTAAQILVEVFFEPMGIGH